MMPRGAGDVAASGWVQPRAGVFTRRALGKGEGRGEGCRGSVAAGTRVILANVGMHPGCPLSNDPLLAGHCALWLSPLWCPPPCRASPASLRTPSPGPLSTKTLQVGQDGMGTCQGPAGWGGGGDPAPPGCVHSTPGPCRAATWVAPGDGATLSVPAGDGGAGGGSPCSG